MSDGRDYKVGKGKPPPWGQFRKGEPSRNPKGRPRKNPKPEVTVDQSELDRIYRRELDREYDTKIGGRVEKMSALEITVISQIKAAATGNSNAQRDVLRNAQELAVREQAAREMAERDARETFAKVVKFKKYRAQIWEAADRNDLEPVEYWPHPDDILIDDVKQTWRIRGPFSDEDLPLFEYMEAGRDLAFLEEELALRRRDKLGKALASLWRIAWVTFDVQLPLAWQVMPNLEWKLFNLALNDTRKLRRLRNQWEEEFELARIRAGIPWRTKEVYREVNKNMKPLLKRLGYSSLAQFEAACSAEKTSRSI